MSSNKVWLFTLLIAFALLTLPLAAAEPRVHGPEAKAAKLNVDALQALDQALQGQVEDKHVSGVIAMIGRGQTIGYYETFGHRDVAKEAAMDKDTLFRIFSMTKPIVAVTAMSIWEEGKFKLDDPISNHLPEWKDVKVKVGDEVVEAKSPITPRHLMTHSAGLSYSKQGLWSLGKKGTLSEFSQALAKRPLEFQPGTKYVYGYSIDILGRYLEAIEGKTLDVIMRERVFDRLAMNDTEFWVRDKADRGRIAQVYRQPKPGELSAWMSPDAVLTKPTRMMGGQGLMSTAGDYSRFCQMLVNRGELDGQRVLKSSTVDLMLENHLEKIGKVYGLGGLVDGRGRYSWGGAAGTRFWVDTKSNSYAVFMVQTWGYSPPTFGVFRRHATKALAPSP